MKRKTFQRKTDLEKRWRERGNKRHEMGIQGRDQVYILEEQRARAAMSLMGRQRMQVTGGAAEGHGRYEFL